MLFLPLTQLLSPSYVHFGGNITALASRELFPSSPEGFLGTRTRLDFLRLLHMSWILQRLRATELPTVHPHFCRVLSTFSSSSQTSASLNLTVMPGRELAPLARLVYAQGGAVPRVWP